MPEFKKNPGGMKPSGFKMKGYSYPGTSPLKGARKQRELSEASDRSDAAFENFKKTEEMTSTDLLKGDPFTIEYPETTPSPITKKASPARYEPDLSAEIVPVDDPRNSANNKPSPKPKQEDPKPKNVIKPGKNMSSSKFEYSNAGKAPEASQTPYEKPVKEKIKVQTPPPPEKSKMSKFLGSEVGAQAIGSVVNAGLQIGINALMTKKEKPARKSANISGFSKMKFGRSK